MVLILLANVNQEVVKFGTRQSVVVLAQETRPGTLPLAHVDVLMVKLGIQLQTGASAMTPKPTGCGTLRILHVSAWTVLTWTQVTVSANAQLELHGMELILCANATTLLMVKSMTGQHLDVNAQMYKLGYQPPPVEIHANAQDGTSIEVEPLGTTGKINVNANGIMKVKSGMEPMVNADAQPTPLGTETGEHASVMSMVKNWTLTQPPVDAQLAITGNLRTLIHQLLERVSAHTAANSDGTTGQPLLVRPTTHSRIL